MSDTVLDLQARLAHQRSLYDCMEVVLGKLQHDRASITTAGAQALADVARNGDTRMATVVAALRDLAPRSGSSEGALPHEGDCTPTSRLSQLMDDLHTTVIAHPGDVTPRTIQSMQGILDAMQRAISHTQAPHPELQAEIQQQYARIVPKVEAMTASNAEYSDAHFPKKQTNGHIEPNGSEITSHSTSVDGRQQALNNGDGQVAHETTNNENAATADVQKPNETSENISKQIAESAVSAAGDRRIANRFPGKEDRSCLDARNGGSRDTV